MKKPTLYDILKQMIIKSEDCAMADDAKNKVDLFLEQKKTLDIFLSNGAITKAQYDKSYGDLVKLMGMEEIAKKLESEEKK